MDGCSIEDFEKDLKNNLYKIWNRMSSGSYFPPPVLAVEIPKPHGGGTRILGVPTVADRIAQTVAARRLEAKVEPIFHPDSYGYRPGQVGAGRGRDMPESAAGSTDWVIDLDIQKFFDSVPLGSRRQGGGGQHRCPVGGAVCQTVARRPRCSCPTGPCRNGTAEPHRVRRSSPVLANLFLHYAFDAWMAREFPTVPFERYVDDAVVHCNSEPQARHVVAAIADRMDQVGLRLHPDKTKIVYCKDGNRRGSYEHTAFTFLGFTFRQRRARNRHGKSFSKFLPAISKDALKKISAEVRSWRLHLRTGHTFKDLARRINPIVAGWMQYYGAFYRSALSPLLQRINAYLMRWIRKKYKRLQGKKKARECWQGITERYPLMFAHWKWVPSVQWS